MTKPGSIVVMTRTNGRVHILVADRFRLDADRPFERKRGLIDLVGGAIFLREQQPAQGGETPTSEGLGGLALVVVGVSLIATQGDLTAFRRPDGQAGVRWGTASGGLIASYIVVDAYAVKALGIAPVILDWLSNLLRFCMLLPLVLTNPKRAFVRMRGSWWIAIGVGLLSPLSYILVLATLTTGAPLSLVAPMREMSMMVGALMGMLVLRETVGPWRLAGCALLIGGVILLSAG